MFSSLAVFMSSVLNVLGAWSTVATPYLFTYLALGIPGLYLSVRYSNMVIDYKDRDMISIFYLTWPLVLSSILAGKVLSTCKFIGKVAIGSFFLLVEAVERGLEGVARVAERSKRKKLKKNNEYVALLEELEE